MSAIIQLISVYRNMQWPITDNFPNAIAFVSGPERILTRLQCRCSLGEDHRWATGN